MPVPEPSRGPGRPPLPRAACAPVSASPTRSPLELRTLVDGEEGCYRLISLTHSEGVVVGGVMTSAIVSETGVSYREVSDRRGNAIGLRAVVDSKNSCSVLRDSPYAYLGATAKVPLWISRANGSIGQTLRVKAGNLRSGKRWDIQSTASGYDLDAFVTSLQTQSTFSAGRLPDGSIEIYSTATFQEPGDPAPIRRTIRAVYLPDFETDSGDVDTDTPPNDGDSSSTDPNTNDGTDSNSGS